MKVTIDGTVIEGTPEEIKEMMTLLGAEPKAEEVEEEASLTIKEGDKVKALVDGQFEDIKAGEIGEITNMDAGTSIDDPNYIRVKTEDYDSDYFRPQALKKVTEEEEEETPKFSEGDIVVITANTNSSSNEVGDIGVVRYLDGKKSPLVNVPGRNQGVGWNHTKIDEMRPATDEEKTQYERAVKDAEWAKFGRQPNEFKKGDIVSDGTGDAIFTVLSGYEIETGSVRFPEMIRRNIDEVKLVAPVEARVDV